MYKQIKINSYHIYLYHMELRKVILRETLSEEWEILNRSIEVGTVEIILNIS